jgi:hypothetical protein
MTFADSGGWYALFVPDDPDHSSALDWMAGNPGPLITTDCVVDETLTLMRARGHNRKALDFGLAVFAGRLGDLHFVRADEVDRAWGVFHTFRDKEWSFTDYTSKVMMELLGVTRAFSFDQHFRLFGTVAVVP